MRGVHFGGLTRHRLLRLSSLLLFPVLLLASGCSLPWDHSADIKHASFVLDGVTVAVDSAFLPSTTFAASQPGNATQGAAVETYKPYRYVGVVAIPFGFASPTEPFPVAKAGGAADYRAVLLKEQMQQGGTPSTAAPAISLFGQKVPGAASLMQQQIYGAMATPTLAAAWVAEAGQRLWVVRVEAEQPRGTNSIQAVSSVLDSLSDMKLSSTTLDHPTTLASASEPDSAGPLAAHATSMSLSLGASSRGRQLGPGSPVTSFPSVPLPSWWQGTVCDTVHHAKSYPLFTLNGLTACGPRSFVVGNGNDVFTTFGGTQSLSNREWQCVELSERYLWLEFKVHAYGADGWQIVDSYQGSVLQKIHAPSAESAHLVPQAGDVLSMGRYDPGHTAVVTDSQVDRNGYGTLSFMQQNETANGQGSVQVRAWRIDPYDSNPITGWLHAPGPSGSSGNNTPPQSVQPPQRLGQVGATQTSISLTWDAPDSGSAPAKYRVYRNGAVVTTTGATAFTDTGLRPGTLYAYSAQSIDANGQVSDLSPSIQMQTLDVAFAFLAFAYHDMLGRPADYGGMTYWTGLLNTGSTRIAVAQDLAFSTEFRQHTINQLYQKYFGRSADPGGLQYWVDQLGHSTYEQVEGQLLATSEYYSHAGGTDDGFLTHLYSDVFGRAPDAGGMAYWKQQLAGGESRGNVAAFFITTDEGYAHAVANWYQQYLHRALDASGQQYWVSQLKQGTRDEQAIGVIVGSDEYQGNATRAYLQQLYRDVLNRAPTDQEIKTAQDKLANGTPGALLASDLLDSVEHRIQVVNALYTTFLKRSADGDGLEYWVDQMDNLSYEQVEAQILGSQEYYSRAGGTNDGFISAVYRDVLGRAPDDAGRVTWNAQLAGGVTRIDVAYAILTTPEARGRLVGSVYQQYLRRAADSSGQQYWVAQMVTGAGKPGMTEMTLRANFLATDEYIAYVVAHRIAG